MWGPLRVIIFSLSAQTALCQVSFKNSLFLLTCCAFSGDAPLYFEQQHYYPTVVVCRNAPCSTTRHPRRVAVRSLTHVHNSENLLLDLNFGFPSCGAQSISMLLCYPPRYLMLIPGSVFNWITTKLVPYDRTWHELLYWRGP